MPKFKSARPVAHRRLRLEFAWYSDDRRSKEDRDREAEDKPEAGEMLNEDIDLPGKHKSELEDGLEVGDEPEVEDNLPEVGDELEVKDKLEVADKPEAEGKSGAGGDRGDRDGDNYGGGHERLSQYNDGVGQLKGVEYGVKGARYDEASVDPNPIDIANAKECLLAVGYGAIQVAMPPIGATVLYGPSAAWYMAAANHQELVLQQPLDDLEIKEAAGTFEIVDDKKIVYASNLEMQAEDGKKYSVTSILSMDGALKDRDKDGYADSFNLDEVTGRVVVAMVDESSYQPFIASEYSFELKNKLDILSSYGVKSTYGAPGKSRVGVSPAFKSPTQSIAKQTGYAFSAGSSLAALDPFIESHSGEIAAVSHDWVRCMNELRASGSNSSLEILALACASILL